MVHVVNQTKQLPKSGSVKEIFGKVVLFKRNAVIVNPDYPMIDNDDIRNFVQFVEGKKTAVVTGCKVDDDVHPYRLVSKDMDGFVQFTVDISEKVRGARQRYPDVFRFVPALIYIPPVCSKSVLDNTEALELFELDAIKLLDASHELESLQIINEQRNNWNQQSGHWKSTSDMKGVSA